MVLQSYMEGKLFILKELSNVIKTCIHSLKFCWKMKNLCSQACYEPAYFASVSVYGISVFVLIFFLLKKMLPSSEC